MQLPYGMAQLHREDMGEAAPSVWAWREGFADGWGLHSAQRDKVGPARGMREGDSKTRGRDQQRKEWEEQSLLGIRETPGMAGVE